MLEADSWTRTGKLVRFSADAELSRVIFRRASQEVLQAVEEMLHQGSNAELSEICTSPKSCAVPLLSLAVCVGPPANVTVPPPLVTVAPLVTTRLPFKVTSDAGNDATAQDLGDVQIS